MPDAATTPAPARLDLDETAVRYTCVLPVPRRAVAFVAGLLTDHQRHLGTRAGRRALDAWDQSVAFWRWMLDGAELERLARDVGIGRSTAHRMVNEALSVVADQAPGLHGVLIAARAAGHAHVNLDGTVIRTDRVSTPGPTTARTAKKSGPKRAKVDLWWSGKHHCHGGNVQVVTAARHDPDLLTTLGAWRDGEHAVLADLGYEGEREVLTLPVRTEANGVDDRGQLVSLTEDQACVNALHRATRARAEAGNAWLKMTFKVLRRVRINPWRIGALTAAALVLLHVIYDRTT